MEENFGWSFFRCSVYNNLSTKQKKFKMKMKICFHKYQICTLNFEKKKKKLIKKIKSLEFAKLGVYEGVAGEMC